MKKAHALGTGVIGVALSATAALAAAPLVTSSPASTEGSTELISANANQAPTDNHGAIVSAVAHDQGATGGENDNHGGAVSAVARGDHGPDDASVPAAVPAPAADQKPADNHGAVVSAVAKDKEATGGKNDNHGGAVSAAAHEDHSSNGHEPNEHANENASGHH